jgi:DNA-binding MarR family transcriptional regulator
MGEETRLLQLLDRLRRLGLGMESHPFANAGIGPPQLMLINQIARNPGCRLKEVAEALRLTSPTVSVAVRQLERKGLVERRPHPEDHRAVQLFLSRKGKDLHRRIESFRREKIRRLFAGLSPEERSTLVELLQRALDLAEQDGAGDRP